MTTRMRKLTSTFMLTLAFTLVITLSLLTSCRRPLEVYYEGTTQVRINVDWMSRFGEMPTGMTMLLYQNDDHLYRTIISNEVRTQVLQLEPAVYKLVIFNQSDDEFGTMRFENLQSHHNAAARARPITTRASRKWDEGVRYMCDPEAIGVAVDTFAITQEMVDDHLTFIDYRDRDEIADTAYYVYNEVVDPMATRLNVRIMVKGFKSLRSVEANISGMADGFYLSRVDRTQETGILLLDSWKATPIADSDNMGWITTSSATFGLPFGKERAANRAPEDNVLTLGVLLVDGTVRTYHYNVGKIMRYLTPSGDALTKQEVLRQIEIEIVIDDPIDLPDVDPKDSEYASGFDAHVDNWDDGGTIDIGGF